MLRRMFILSMLLIGSVSARAVDALSTAVADGHGLAFVVNPQGVIDVSPNFTTIQQQINVLFAQYQLTPKAQRADSLHIRLITLVGARNGASGSALLARFDTSCLVMPTSLLHADDAKRLGMIKLAYDFIQTKDTTPYRMFLLCDPNVEQARWASLIHFNQDGFNLMRQQEHGRSFWYFDTQAGEIGFYF